MHRCSLDVSKHFVVCPAFVSTALHVGSIVDMHDQHCGLPAECCYDLAACVVESFLFLKAPSANFVGFVSDSLVSFSVLPESLQCRFDILCARQQGILAWL